MLVQESTPVVDHSPAFLFPPPELLFTNDAIRFARPTFKGIFIYMVARYYSATTLL
jgi:hypothetical protein